MKNQVILEDIDEVIFKDFLASIPPVEEAERELDEFLAKRAAGLLVEGVDYGFPVGFFDNADK